MGKKTEIAKTQGTEITNPNTMDEFKDTVGGGDFLRRLQVMGSSSELVKKGDMQLSTFALISQGEGEQLQSEVDVILFSWRPKAMDTSTDIPVIVYDKGHELWADLVAKAAVQNSGCMYGVEFLCYLPILDEFVTFYCGGVSLRRESKKIIKYMGDNGQTPGPCTLEVVYIDPTTSKYSWHSAKSKACVTDLEYPDSTRTVEVVTKFLSPPAVTGLQEKVEEEETQAR